MIKLIDTLNMKCDIEFNFDVEATTYVSPYSPVGVIKNAISVKNNNSHNQNSIDHKEHKS